ncbi:MAG: hypothetical protein KG003_07270 [Bacteroidetes bacterium]|nr:hypothetical protein [Bacteroidota bacterium]
MALIKQCISFSSLVDWNEYHASAVNLFDKFTWDSCVIGRGNCDHILHETRRTPGFPLIIIITFYSKYLLIAAQIIPAILVPVIAKRILLLLNLDDKVFNRFLIFLLLFPLQFFYSAFPMPEIWCQYLLLFGWLSLLQKNIRMLAFSVAALVLLKPVFVILALLLVVYACFQFKKRWMLFFPIAIVGSISFVNYSRYDKFHYSSISVENAWEYNLVALHNRTLTESEIIDFRKNASKEIEENTFKNKYNYLRKNTKLEIIKHWPEYVWIHIKGAVLGSIDPGRYDLIAFFDIKETPGLSNIKSRTQNAILSQPWPVLMYIILFLLMQIFRWILVCIALFRAPGKWIVPCLIIAIFVFIPGPVGSARYLVPLMPVICIIAATGLNSIPHREKNISLQR